MSMVSVLQKLYQALYRTLKTATCALLTLYRIGH